MTANSRDDLKIHDIQFILTETSNRRSILKMQKHKRFFILLSCFLPVLILFFIFFGKQEIPSRYRGNWIFSLDKTILNNRKNPEWKEQYEINLRKSRYIMGYRVNSTSLGATFDGKGKMCSVKHLKITSDSIVIVPNIPQKISVTLTLSDRDTLCMSSTASSYPLLYERQKED